MKHLKKIAAATAALGGLAAVSPLSALAQVNTNINLGLPAGSSFTNITGYTPTGFIQSMINLLLVGAGLIAFFWLLYGGVQWILAGGDKEATEKARKRITAALIGLVIVFSVFAFTLLLGQFFGVDLLNFTVTTNLNV
ncbi:hypothetical protein A2634_02990 [Candidatus Amesbacteria bacterium RIFCSPHIGHO2_01_FULL_48_32]|uniref:Uncharacterized protein n=1 Tax=Candidatus Amesbacteria bacterium RIFCSPLOWO2_01_FULL_48_25 TaxID=1797259 RepID=A0A1F4ZB37_9BACT|nr:MAG: hypothetical protein A2634_02990 [Candidatus Amesbacteria bacterium RIFCSPHIGHO2_01_FULL_48_32]OGD03107.1 MAG: hypothetical protein A2989_02210 [Candidatus Amesbacteria bacterium RIFCSPLOWO2_01_FULL_48_25]